MNNSDSQNSVLLDIYREVGETKVAIDSLDKKVETHIRFSLEEFNKINELDQEQNSILDKHIEGVNTLKAMYVEHRKESLKQIAILNETLELQKKEYEVRLKEVEEPLAFIKYLGKVLMWVASISAGILAIANLIR